MSESNDKLDGIADENLTTENENSNDEKKSSKVDIALYISMGLCLGSAMGIVFGGSDGLVYGTSLGMVAGLLYGTYKEKNMGDKNEAGSNENKED